MTGRTEHSDGQSLARPSGGSWGPGQGSHLVGLIDVGVYAVLNHFFHQERVWLVANLSTQEKRHQEPTRLGLGSHQSPSKQNVPSLPKSKAPRTKLPTPRYKFLIPCGCVSLDWGIWGWCAQNHGGPTGEQGGHLGPSVPWSRNWLSLQGFSSLSVTRRR
jgi:hypothetical protein